jgi:hypothetical protein
MVHVVHGHGQAGHVIVKTVAMSLELLRTTMLEPGPSLWVVKERDQAMLISHKVGGVSAAPVTWHRSSSCGIDKPAYVSTNKLGSIQGVQCSMYFPKCCPAWLIRTRPPVSFQTLAI